MPPMPRDPLTSPDQFREAIAALLRAQLTLRPLGDDIVMVSADGAPLCVLLTPEAWCKAQATAAAWQRLFRWAAEHLDTPTLQAMTASAEEAVRHAVDPGGRHPRSPACHPGRQGAPGMKCRRAAADPTTAPR
jgi:hypothetical protein